MNLNEKIIMVRKSKVNLKIVSIIQLLTMNEN